MFKYNLVILLCGILFSQGISQETRTTMNDFLFLMGKWKAVSDDSSFVSMLEYQISPNGKLFWGSNHLYDKNGTLFRHYEGTYYLKGDEIVYFLSGTGGEVHNGNATINGDTLTNFATIQPGNSIKSYMSQMILQDGKLFYHANYSMEMSIPEHIDYGNPLVYERVSDAIAQPIPTWFLEDMENRVGTWIADNSIYQSDNEPFDSYGLQWEYGLGQKHLKGRLYCIKDNKDVATAWNFTEYWNPVTGKVEVLQIGGDGTVGQGTLWKEDDGVTMEQQTFTSPGGGSFESGHKSWMENGEQHTQSFNIVNGEWMKRRFYIWKKKPEKGQLTSHLLHSEMLKANKINESPSREILIYTPPGYSANNRKAYPVLYLLHGYGETAEAWLDSPHTQGLNIQVALDSLIHGGVIRELIVVMPDCQNKFGGGWYTNSSSSGLWEDYFIKELIPFVDKEYNTNADLRGIAGHSMGGYGSLRLAMKNPDSFTAVYAMSSVNLADDKLAKMQFPNLLKQMENNAQLADYSLFDKLLMSKSLAFVPNDMPPYYCHPLFSKKGEDVKLDEGIWDLWSQQLLVNIIPDFKSKNQPLQIALDHGSEDFLVSETRTFSRQLHEAGIDHTFSEYPGGHTDQVRSRIENHVLPFFSRIFYPTAQ